MIVVQLKAALNTIIIIIYTDSPFVSTKIKLEVFAHVDTMLYEMIVCIIKTACES